MKTLVIIVASYIVLVCETTIAPLWSFRPPVSCWAWLMLPWFAARIKGGRAILAAALFGFCIDALSQAPLGVGVCISVIGTLALQFLISEDSMKSASSVVVWTVCTCWIVAVALCAVQLASGTLAESMNVAVVRVSWSSAIAALVVAIIVRAMQPWRDHSLRAEAI